MKLINFFIIVGFISLFIGCTSTTQNISKESNSYSPNMTSSQVEEQMGWKYCEESK